MIDDSKTRYYTIRANRTGDILALVRAATKAAPNGSARLVEASNPAQALRYVARDAYEVDVPSSLEVARLMSAGVKPEQAKAEPAAA